MISNNFKSILLRRLFVDTTNSTSTLLPTSFTIGLSAADPGEKGGRPTEPGSNTGYRRVACSFELRSNVEGMEGESVAVNSTDIVFPESTADWFTASAPATHYIIFGNNTGPNTPIMYNRLTTSRIIEAGTVATIKKGSLIIRLTD